MFGVRFYVWGFELLLGERDVIYFELDDEMMILIVLHYGQRTFGNGN